MTLSRIKYRFFAALADLVINVVVIFFIMILTSTAPLISLIIDGSSIQFDAVLLYRIVQAGIIIEIYLIVYSTVVPLYTHGQTLGKYLFKIRMVMQDETDCGFAALFIRQTLAKTLLNALTFGFSIIVSFILILYRRDRSSIADILAKTKVVDVVSKEE